MKLSDALVSDLLTKCDLRAIAAMSPNGVIGANGTIPWKIPSELQFFRKTTLYSSVLMGRKTFQSIGHALPKRKNIVLSNSNISIEGTIVINSVDQIMQFGGTVWVCGGESIYQLLLPACRELYLSIINENYQGDAFFPNYKNFFQNPEIIHSDPLFHTEKMINKKLI